MNIYKGFTLVVLSALAAVLIGTMLNSLTLQADTETLIRGTSAVSAAVQGNSTNGIGVEGISPGAGMGVHGSSSSGPGILGESSTSAGVLGNSKSNTGVWGQSSSGDGVLGTSNSGYAMDSNGDARQDLKGGGWVKAMILVYGADIKRCYNSQGSKPNSTAPCGFSVTKNAPGDYSVNFGFKVEDRYFSIVPYWGGAGQVSPLVVSMSGTTVRISTRNGTGQAVDSAFFVLVY